MDETSILDEVFWSRKDSLDDAYFEQIKDKKEHDTIDIMEDIRKIIREKINDKILLNTLLEKLDELDKVNLQEIANINLYYYKIGFRDAKRICTLQY